MHALFALFIGSFATIKYAGLVSRSLGSSNVGSEAGTVVVGCKLVEYIG